jgi:hypothetical protein
MFLEQMDNFSNDFKSLFIIIENTIKKRETIILKINSLKTQYNDLLKVNNKKLFLLCLDSFFFQYKYFCRRVSITLTVMDIIVFRIRI